MVRTKVSRTVRFSRKPNKPKIFRRKQSKDWDRFVSIAKGFTRKGYVSRGTPIHEGVCLYFLNVAHRLQQGFEIVEDEVTIANNVLEQTRGQEVHLSSNQVASSVITRLIAFANPEIFERYLTAFAENFQQICSDSYASHVIQKVIDVGFLRAVYYKKQNENDDGEHANKKGQYDPNEFEKKHNLAQEFENSHREKCSDFIEKIGKFLVNNLETFLWDPLASHIIRKSIIALAGIRKVHTDFSVSEEVPNRKEVVAVPEAWIGILNKYFERLQAWPQFADLPYKACSSLVLAHLLVALKTCNEHAFKHLALKILVESFIQADEGKNEEATLVMEGNDNEEQNKDAEGAKISKHNVTLPKPFESICSMRILLAVLCTVENDIFSQLYSKFFMGRVSKLACNMHTCFTVQKLIEHIKEPSEFKSVFEELRPSMKVLLRVGYSGVVEALAKTCLRLSTKQGAFVSAILSALDISDSTEKFNFLIMCILKLEPYDVAIVDKTNFIHIHGSLILQHMLQFNKANQLTQYMLKIPAWDLAVIFSNMYGFHVANMFIRSKTISDQSRQKLLRHLKGEYSRMALKQFGFIVVKNFLEVANEKRKTKIVKELLKKPNYLRKTLCGRAMYNLLQTDTYQLSPTPGRVTISKTKRDGTQMKAVKTKSVSNGVEEKAVISELKKSKTKKKVAIAKTKQPERRKKIGKSKAENVKTPVTDVVQEIHAGMDEHCVS